MSTDDTISTSLASLSDVGDLAQVIELAQDAAEAVRNFAEVGDRGRTYLVPDGHRLEHVDVTDFEDLPRSRTGTFQFVGVDSFARYVERYRTEDSLAYVHDVYGKGTALLTGDLTAAKVVLDDHPSAAGSDHDLDQQAANRQHVALLVLRPTAAARRWGAVLGKVLGQEDFLDLVVDGISEIATPEGALLRDLVSNLHAIRNTSVKSVIRTGGEGAIELADNVSLSAGTGARMTFPEEIKVVLQPYAGIGDTIALTVRVKAQVRQDHVVFGLTCSELDDAIARVLGDVAGEILERTTLHPHWIP